MAGRQAEPPLVERAPAPRWKLLLVVIAAAFALWQLRDLAVPAPVSRTPAVRQIARPAPLDQSRPAQLAFTPGRSDPRAPASVYGGDAAQQAVLGVVGQSFESLAALDDALGGWQFARVGRFGEVWPAAVVQARAGFEAVEFEHAGQVHRYTGFTNADVLALTLAGEGDEPVSVVYRRLREPAR